MKKAIIILLREKVVGDKKLHGKRERERVEDDGDLDDRVLQSHNNSKDID